MSILLKVLMFLAGVLCAYDGLMILGGKRRVVIADLLLGVVSCVLLFKHSIIFSLFGILIFLVGIFQNSLNTNVVKFTGISSNIIVLVSLLLV